MLYCLGHTVKYTRHQASLIVLSYSHCITATLCALRSSTGLCPLHHPLLTLCTRFNVMHAVCARDGRRVHATEFMRVIASNKIAFIQAGCAQIATVYLRTDICTMPVHSRSLKESDRFRYVSHPNGCDTYRIRCLL